MIAANTNNEGKSEPPTEAGCKIKNAFSSFYAFVTGHGPVLQWESSYYIQAGGSAINGEEDEFGRMAGLQRELPAVPSLRYAPLSSHWGARALAAPMVSSIRKAGIRNKRGRIGGMMICCRGFPCDVGPLVPTKFSNATEVTNVAPTTRAVR